MNWQAAFGLVLGVFVCLAFVWLMVLITEVLETRIGKGPATIFSLVVIVLVGALIAGLTIP